MPLTVLPPHILLPATLVAISLSSALLSLLLITVMLRRNRARTAGLGEAAEIGAEDHAAVFLFDDQLLVEASPAAQGLFDTLPPGASDWARLAAFLAPRFPGIEGRIARLADIGTLDLRSEEPAPLRLRAEMAGALARITLVDLTAEGQSVRLDALSLRAMEDELRALRDTVQHLPAPVWRSDAEGQVIWANRAYLSLIRSEADAPEGVAAAWPLPQLFDPVPQDKGTRRLRLDRPASGGRDGTRWFEGYRHNLPGGRLGVALPADATVRAEAALREFVQTLTKTFAHLPIGLAIFDRQRQLALFNPALTDLTTLGAEFLSARPTLFAFLDRLREARMIPEPKDYGSWRRDMAALEKAAASGQYSEVWALAGGQTWQVTGRPHPDGAVALMIEDISAEMSLTRRFRSELELGQSVVDALDEGIAVFSPTGSLIMSNAAYGRIWGQDPERLMAETGLSATIRLWQARGLPNQTWEAARDFLSRSGPRPDWGAEVTLWGGQRLSFRLRTLPGGRVMASFRPLDGGALQVARQRRRGGLSAIAANRPEQEAPPA
ncbi:PAS-domain containing protein [Frigidibacter oleivorans]|uniref:PAS-domain containing protein n=1 Tax=Frigidibacter oleivorans TaxID=2487129 RepID=UPI000F8E37F4|nr:PAS-domain containing protein [Frigidibacter oleivorans]